MINEEIKDRQVRVIDSNGEQLGVMPIAEALALADQKQLDLVKIADKTEIPVCKLLDYDKHRYEQSKYEREMRKKQKVVILKEVQLSVTIEENDLLTKVKRAIKFLETGDKVKVVIRFRGRQIAHTDIATNLMRDFAKRASEVSTIQKEPLVEGRNMIMILAPKAEKQSFAERAENKRKEKAD